MIPFVLVGAAVAVPLAGCVTMVSDSGFTAEAPPLTRVSASNWLGGLVVPGVYAALPLAITGALAAAACPPSKVSVAPETVAPRTSAVTAVRRPDSENSERIGFGPPSWQARRRATDSTIAPIPHRLRRAACGET